MVNSTPNAIREYYIAYFDILGYKEFFSRTPEKASEFLDMIHAAIQDTKEYIRTTNQSVIATAYGKINVKVKVFSDNILLCMETSDETIESVRLLAFLKIVADIQRRFVTEYKLFVRGGITRSEMSFNEDYVFGNGLIEVVKMEENARFPRIVVDKIIVETLIVNRFYSQEEADRAIEIETRNNNGISLTEEEIAFYNATHFKAQMLQVVLALIRSLLMPWADGEWVINYLHQIHSADMLGSKKLKEFIDLFKQISPEGFYEALQATLNLEGVTLEQDSLKDETILSKHKRIVEEKLSEYGCNQDIAICDIKKAELRESILRKYIWVMAFHNCVCNTYHKPQYKICTICNCDARFLKMTIEVLKDETGV